MRIRVIGCIAVLAAVAVVGAGCAQPSQLSGRDFGQDVAFLADHAEVIVLSDPAGQAKVAIVPDYQGRVMTSTAGGDAGFSYGWINYELISSGEIQPHINVYGGEDRFWMGPEGGQYAIFFERGASFNLEDWQTPAVIDTEPFEVVATSDSSASFSRRATVTNYSGTEFDLLVRRTVHLLDPANARLALHTSVPPTVDMVAYQSDNSLTNTGERPWTKETGLLSIWILGMYKPSPETTIVIPFIEGPESELGPRVNADYFGEVPAERLAVRDGVIYFSGDGQYRSKIGVGPLRAKPIMGSYDAANQVLTIVQYTKPEGVTDYVNSMWELQEEPYAGDVVNSYNDGPPAPGEDPLGPFYELETSSPAAALAPGQTIRHMHRTIHLQGPESDLDPIAQELLGVSLEEIKTALPQQ